MFVAIGCAIASAMAAVAIGTAAGHGTRPARSSSNPTAHPIRASDRASAVVFLRRTIRLLAANEYARAWATLDPSQQRFVPRDEYTRCEAASPIPGALARIVPLEARLERVLVAGADPEPLDSVAVTFRLAFAPRPKRAAVVVRARAHALRVDGRWAWMLSARRFALHTSGRCGVLQPFTPGPSL
jgi:hypothetical protein